MQPGLRRRVVERAAAAAAGVRGDRADVDDAPAGPGEVRREGDRHQKRAFEIGANRRVPGTLGRVQWRIGGDAPREPGRVHQHVHMAMPRENPGDRPLDVVAAADVRLDPPDALAYLLCRRAQRLLPAAQDTELPARLGEGGGARAPHAAAAPGDDDDTSVLLAHVAHALPPVVYAHAHSIDKLA